MDTDRELVARYLAGDLKAFEILFERHERPVYSYAFHMTSNCSEADDLCQDVWLEAIRSLSTFQSRAAFRAWIHGVAVNVYRRRHRKKSVTSVPLDEECDAQQMDPNPQAAADARLMVREALSRLPDEQREVVILHELQGFTYSEISRILDCPDGTVKSRLHYAMQALRRMLGAESKRGR